MPTTPCLIHSQGTLHTFPTLDGGEVWIANGCVCRQGPRGIEVLACSGDAEDWLRSHVPMSERLAVFLQRLRWQRFDSHQTRERSG